MAEIGTHRKRVEDPCLLRGEGLYVDDLRLGNTAEVAFVRSAYAHARVTHVDVEAALRAQALGIQRGSVDRERRDARSRG